MLALADAAIAFAKSSSKDHSGVVQRLRELKLKAERKLGSLLAVMPKANGGDAQRTRFQTGTESPATLADLGIGKKLSMRAQQLAALPVDTFDAVAAGAVTLRGAVEAERKRPKLKAAKKRKAAEPTIIDTVNASRSELGSMVRRMLRSWP